MEAFIIIFWTIQKQRNDHIFRQIRPTLQKWKGDFTKEVSLQLHRMRDVLDHSYSSWPNALV